MNSQHSGYEPLFQYLFHNGWAFLFICLKTVIRHYSQTQALAQKIRWCRHHNSFRLWFIGRDLESFDPKRLPYICHILIWRHSENLSRIWARVRMVFIYPALPLNSLSNRLWDLVNSSWFRANRRHTKQASRPPPKVGGPRYFESEEYDLIKIVGLHTIL